MRGITGFVDWKTVDAGGEFAHGDETVLFDFAIQNSLTPRLVYTWAQGDLELEEQPVGGTHTRDSDLSPFLNFLGS